RALLAGRPQFKPLPDLPALLALEDVDRVGDRLVGDAAERRLEQLRKLVGRVQREGRAALARVEVEEAREASPRLDELGHPLAPVVPEPPRERAQEGTFVDDLEGRLGKRRE